MKFYSFLSALILFLLPGDFLFSIEERILPFSGYSWIVRQSRGVEGPGPNRFSSDISSVWVDEAGLHLTLREDRNRWFSSEVICSESLGYGKYSFVIEANWEEIPLNAVVGLFTYSHNSDYYHREIDIEFSYWGDESRDLGLFTLQPYTEAENQHRFTLKDKNGEYFKEPVRCEFYWIPGEIHYKVTRIIPFDGEEEEVCSWVFYGNVPPPEDESPRINLWMYKGRSPERPYQVILKSFNFEAYREQDNEN